MRQSGLKDLEQQQHPLHRLAFYPSTCQNHTHRRQNPAPCQRPHPALGRAPRPARHTSTSVGRVSSSTAATRALPEHRAGAVLSAVCARLHEPHSPDRGTGPGPKEAKPSAYGGSGLPRQRHGRRCVMLRSRPAPTEGGPWESHPPPTPASVFTPHRARRAPRSPQRQDWGRAISHPGDAHSSSGEAQRPLSTPENHRTTSLHSGPR